MSITPLRVGFIDLNPDSHWAAAAHLPALKALPHRFTVVGVANSSPESSCHTADKLGLPHAFDSVADLVASPEIDVVVVTVKVPHHLALVTQLVIRGAQDAVTKLEPIAPPSSDYAGWPETSIARNVARMADDIRDGTRTAPSFADAVALHESSMPSNARPHRTDRLMRPSQRRAQLQHQAPHKLSLAPKA